MAPPAFAVIDDLGAIVIMALLYAGNLSTTALLIALDGLAVWINVSELLDYFVLRAAIANSTTEPEPVPQAA